MPPMVTCISDTESRQKKRKIEVIEQTKGDAIEEDDWGDDSIDVGPAGAAEISLEAAPSEDVDGSDCERNIVVSINVAEPSSGSRAPVDICCVVDISGSMGSEATYEVDGAVRSDRLSYLDIVKHAVKTVMHMLKDADRVALVAFDERADLVSPLTRMTDAGRAEAVGALESLRPRGHTNLWAGVLAGMEALQASSGAAAEAGRRKTLLVLTDGQPNEVPPEGHLMALRNYKESHPKFNFQLNTFGFGYSLDSKLLLDLAIEGHGTYAFIPDAAILGTVFVNSVANVLSTATQNATLHLTAQGGAKLSGPVLGFGGHEITETSWGKVVHLGPLQYGQNRDIVIPMAVPDGSAVYLSAVLTYPGAGGAEQRAKLETAERHASVTAGAAALRADLVCVGQLALADAEVSAGSGEAREVEIKSLATRINSPAPCTSDPRVEALKADAGGRMAKSVHGAERFNRWGKHYLGALVRAHHLQVCTNFMDPGLQVYGGTLYRSVREAGDAVFVGLPAPRPAADETAIPCDVCRCMIPFSQYAEHSEACANPRRGRPVAGVGGGAVPAPAPDMSDYYQGGGGG